MIRRRDSGFSLIEMTVGITLIGVLATGVSAALQTALRASPVADTTTDEARTMQGVVTWLPQDVDSTPPGGFDLDPARASGCTQSPGTNLLRMQWSEDIGGGPTTYIANYRHVADGSVARIQRITCWGSGAGALGNTKVANASTDLALLPTGWVPGQLPVRVQLVANDGDVIVRFEVQTQNGAIVSTDAAPKNPSDTLPTTSTIATGTTAPTSTVVPTTTTTTIPTTTTTSPVTTTTDPTATTVAPTTTTTVAVTTTTLPPCLLQWGSISPDSVKNTAANGNGKSAANVGVLAEPVTITVGTSGDCTGLEARAQTGAPNGELFRNFSRSGSTYTVTFPGHPQGSSELWADGWRLIRLFTPTGGPYGSIWLFVR